MIEDYLYLIPAMMFTIILALSAGLYLLRGIMQLVKHRKYGSDVSLRLNLTVHNIPRIAIIAGLIVFERIVYRYAYSFALGLELTLLKVLFLTYSYSL